MTRQRKRKPGKREPNGRLSRDPVAIAGRLKDALSQEERDIIEAGVSARERVFGVSATHSRDQMAGSYIGRLCLEGTVTQAQYDAAMKWLEGSRNYSIAVLAPKGMGAVDINATHGFSGDNENEAWTRRCYDRHESAMRAVQDVQDQLRLTANLRGALYFIVARDLELPHLVGQARLALNALVKHYGLCEQSEAA